MKFLLKFVYNAYITQLSTQSRGRGEKSRAPGTSAVKMSNDFFLLILNIQVFKQQLLNKKKRDYQNRLF